MMSMMAVMEKNRIQAFGAALDYFLSKGRGRKAELLATMLSSLMAGKGSMPRNLGLTVANFDSLLGHYFPGIDPKQFHHYGKAQMHERSEEMADLRALFVAQIAPDEPHGGWHATILLSGCMGENHLWQDIGFRSRGELRSYLEEFFPGLVAKNTQDMKWKKFFYKQLCNQEGVYTCRAPSCAVCDDYASCFGPEE